MVREVFVVECFCNRSSKLMVIVSAGTNKIISGRVICRHVPDMTIARAFSQCSFFRPLFMDKTYSSMSSADKGASKPAKFQYTKPLELAQSITGHGDI